MGGARVFLSGVFAADFGRSIRAVIGEVVSFLFRGVESERSLIDELRDLVEPHLAVLIHKRSRYLAPDGNGAVRGERWAKELDDFVSRTFFWPVPVSTEALSRWDRRRIAQTLDGIIAEAQQGAAVASAGLPQTSRFGSSWAD